MKHKIKTRKEHGAALLIILISLTLVMGLGAVFAYTSIINRMVARAEANQTKAELMASSALNRVQAILQETHGQTIYPADTFYRPDSGEWAGRTYLFSQNQMDSGITDALAVNFDDRQFVPATELHESIGWEPVRSLKRTGEGSQQEVITGRISYVIIPESGKLDPTPLVSDGEESEDETPDTGASHTRTGATVEDIPLSKTGFAATFADNFRPQTVEGGQAGKMPDYGWRSFAQMVKTLDPTDAQMDRMVRTVFPYSYSTDTFWRDLNNNDIMDEGESFPRIDLSGKPDVTELYNLFVGGNPTSKADDVTWLKKRDNNNWVQEWQSKTGVSDIEARRRMALQTAANIADYMDEDRNPTPVHLTDQGEIRTGTDEDFYSVYGTERNWGISQVAMRLKAEVLENNGEDTVIVGDAGLKPTQAAMDEFELHTPSGVIDRDTLQNQGSTFEYDGSASKLVYVPKAGGRTMEIGGQSVQLSPNTKYTITSSSMNVHLYNSNPGASNWNAAMGHWWADVDADDATITPDPIENPIVEGFALTPAFKGEVFYPFATEEDESFPPGDLRVSYTVSADLNVSKEDCGSFTTSKSYNGTTALSLTSSENADEGTLCYSPEYSVHREIALGDGHGSSETINEKVVDTDQGEEEENEEEEEEGEEEGGNYCYIYEYTYTYTKNHYSYEYTYQYVWSEDASQDPNPSPNPPNKDPGHPVDPDPDPNPDPQPPDNADEDEIDSFSYRITDVTLRSVELEDDNGNVADIVPVAASGKEGRYLTEWEQELTADSNKTFFASVIAKDALANDPGQSDDEFSLYWNTLPGDGYLSSSGEGEDVGSLSGGTEGYASAAYCDAEVKNDAFTRVGELGRVHSYQPGRSLRLWAASESDETGHDAGILELFTIGEPSPQKGMVNVNTWQREVLRALFSDVTTVGTSQAADAVMAARNDGKIYHNRGQMFGATAGMSGSDPVQDAAEEEAVTKLAELVTANQHVYTVIVCAQGIKDVAGRKYDSNGDGTKDSTAAYNQWDVQKDSTGEVTDHIDRITSEHRIKATLRINPFTKEITVVRIASPFHE